MKVRKLKMENKTDLKEFETLVKKIDRSNIM